MGKDVEERKFVGGSVVGVFVAGLFVRYPEESIIVGRKVEDPIVSEGGIEVASIEEEGRELIFEVGKDVDEGKVVGSFVVDRWVVEKSEGEEVVTDDKVVCAIKDEVSTTESIIVGRKVEDPIVSEGGIEVASIEEEGR